MALSYKFFRLPWATSGTKSAIPDATQVDGTESYDEGFGPKYALDISADVDALAIGRAQFNQLISDITTAARQYQTFGVPEFIASADNNGSPFSYAKYARVLYDGSVYVSLIDSNIDAPTVTSSWLPDPLPRTTSSVWSGATGGTANVLTLTPANPINANEQGQKFRSIIAATNTSGTVTLAVSGKSALPVKKTIGGALVALGIGDLQIGTIVEFENVDGSNYQVVNIRPHAQGADIASASTVNLDAATGDYVAITGTTTITGITLAQGQRRTVKFTGALTITNGSSLICLGAANITTVADDTAEFIGEASGVVRMLAYERATGIQLYQPNQADTAVSIGTGTLTVTPGDKVWKKITATGNFTMAFSFTPSKVCSIILECVNFGAYTITWPAGLGKQIGVLPAFTVAGTDHVVIYQDASNNVYLAMISIDVKP